MDPLNALNTTKIACACRRFGGQEQPGDGGRLRAGVARLKLADHGTPIDGFPGRPGVVVADEMARSIRQRGFWRFKIPRETRRSFRLGRAFIDWYARGDQFDVFFRGVRPGRALFR